MGAAAAVITTIVSVGSRHLSPLLVVLLSKVSSGAVAAGVYIIVRVCRVYCLVSGGRHSIIVAVAANTFVGPESLQSQLSVVAATGSSGGAIVTVNGGIITAQCINRIKNNSPFLATLLCAMATAAAIVTSAVAAAATATD